MDKAGRERPTVITVICVLGFLSVLNQSVRAFSPFVKALGTPFQAYYIAGTLATLWACIGLWQMKKWGAILYALLAVANIIALLMAGVFNRYVVIFSAALAALIVIVCFSQFSKMD